MALRVERVRPAPGRAGAGRLDRLPCRRRCRQVGGSRFRIAGRIAAPSPSLHRRVDPSLGASLHRRAAIAGLAARSCTPFCVFMCGFGCFPPPARRAPRRRVPRVVG